MRRILYLRSIVAHFFIALFLEKSYIVSMKNRDKNEQIVREAAAYCKVVCPNLKRISDKKLPRHRGSFHQHAGKVTMGPFEKVQD